ncbi:MAG TPA: hypothetical protein PK629_09845 [Oscillospiraceae bacterium]|nr:hypothetical protein [Oscillospiraceae bacterium]HPF54932.1 hypothetical protein [Clostridiales bacterium]HPK34991.1 hypothetical protein [Oscillospiraceae bacterium]HPR75549.1 hypothetical protein [Oscillospiraceae bacterium]
MRVGLIIPCNLKYSPYVNYYSEHFKSLGIEYDCIIWDKTGQSDEVGYVFHRKSSTRKISDKIIGYLLFADYIKKTCKNRKYDKIIVFTIVPGLYLLNFLVKRYNGKYILDIRDYSPLITIFPAKFKKLLNCASYVVSSSYEFKSWIKHDFIIGHNVDTNSIRENEQIDNSKVSTKPYKIMFAGSLIEGAINKNLIDTLANCSDITLNYTGTQTQDKIALEQHVLNSKIQNVTFNGVYKKEEIYSIYRNNADFINILRANTPINKNAIPNKLYDAVLAGVPVLVFEHNTGIVKYVNDFNLGIVIEDKPPKEFKSYLLEKLNSYDAKNYMSGRKNFIDHIKDEYEIFHSMLTQWVKNG